MNIYLIYVNSHFLHGLDYGGMGLKNPVPFETFQYYMILTIMTDHELRHKGEIIKPINVATLRYHL